MTRQTAHALAFDAERDELRREFFEMMDRVAEESEDAATHELWEQLMAGSREGLPPSDGLALPPAPFIVGSFLA